MKIKFWQKLYLCVLFVFLLFFNGGIFAIVTAQNSKALAQQKENFLTQQEYILQQIVNDMSLVYESRPLVIPLIIRQYGDRYANNGGAPTTESYHTSVPMLLTEYNVGGEFNSGEEPLFTQHKNFREAMMKYGYAGGFQWCWMPNTYGGGQDMLKYKFQTTNFRAMQYLLYHYYCP